MISHAGGLSSRSQPALSCNTHRTNRDSPAGCSVGWANPSSTPERCIHHHLPASSSLPGSSDQPTQCDQLSLGHILVNMLFLRWMYSGRPTSSSTLAFLVPSAGNLHDTREAVIRWPSASTRFGVGALLLLNAAICTIVLTILKYKSPPADIYRGNL